MTNFRKILYEEARFSRHSKDVKCANVFKRLYCFFRSLELRRQGLSYRKILRVLKSEGFTVAKSNPSEWVRGKHTPMGKINVFDVRVPEVGFLLGMILSDGNEYFNKHNITYSVKFYNTNKDYLEMVKDAYGKLKLSKYISKERKSGWLKRDGWRIATRSVLLYLLLKHYDEYVMGASSEVKEAFLRGLWLGDGYIGKHIEFANTDLKLIKTVDKLLKLFKVEHTIQGPYKQNKPRRKPMYVVHVRAASRQRLLKLISPPRAPKPPSSKLIQLILN